MHRGGGVRPALDRGIGSDVTQCQWGEAKPTRLDAEFRLRDSPDAL